MFRGLRVHTTIAFLSLFFPGLVVEGLPCHLSSAIHLLICLVRSSASPMIIVIEIVFIAGLVKAKKYDWKDTNLALFGSDTEKQVKSKSFQQH